MQKEDTENRDKELMKRLKMQNAPLIVAINKIDIIEKDRLLSLMADIAAEGVEEIIPICAKDGDGVF